MCREQQFTIAEIDLDKDLLEAKDQRLEGSAPHSVEEQNEIARSVAGSNLFSFPPVFLDASL